MPAFLAFSVIPFGPMVSIFGHETPLQLTDLPVGVLVVFACASLGVYGIVLSGWASGSTYPLLGGLRSAGADDLLRGRDGPVVRRGVPLRGHDVHLGHRAAQQKHLVRPAAAAVSFLIYAVAVVGETNRAPFDLPEAESELVGGFHTEYSSLKFALFFLAEYINMVTVSALATTLFLGGWRAPWPLSVWAGANSGWWPMLWFIAQGDRACIFVFVWLRGTLPRLRYDQFMAFGWKVLVPVALVWILLDRHVQRAAQRGPQHRPAAAVVGAPAGRGHHRVVTLFWPERPGGRGRGRGRATRRRRPGRAGAAGAFPMPPMDLVDPAVAAAAGA